VTLKISFLGAAGTVTGSRYLVVTTRPVGVSAPAPPISNSASLFQLNSFKSRRTKVTQGLG